MSFEYRAASYDRLEWVNDKNFLKHIIKFIKPKQSDIILDVGCGTGVISSELKKHSDIVIGTDISLQMLDFSKYKHGEVVYFQDDITHSKLLDNTFTIIVARNVFHHIGDMNKALKECMRLLKPGGKMYIIEGVPPMNEAEEFFTEVFKLKEPRNVLTFDSIELMLLRNGFRNVKFTGHIIPENNILEWLQNDGSLSEYIINEIHDMHLNMSDDLKKMYDSKIIDDICYCDFTNAIVMGVKISDN